MPETVTAQTVVLEPDSLSVLWVRQAMRMLHLDTQARYWLQREVEPASHRTPADLVVMGLDGHPNEDLQWLTHVRQAYPGAVVMGLGYPTRSEDRCRLFDAGLDSWLDKPFSAQECASTIRALLRRQDMRRAL